jgi:membrane fusion protein (multidrug efflux system)
MSARVPPRSLDRHAPRSLVWLLARARADDLASLPARRVAARGTRRAGTRVNALCLAALALACGEGQSQSGPPGPPPVVVAVVTVAAETLPQVIEAVGTVASPERTPIAAEVEERVVEVMIPEGQKVDAGHLLVMLDDVRARAALRGARARLENARTRLARLEKLRSSSVSSEQAYDDALATYESAASELEQAQTRVARTEIRAPFAGVLGLSQVDAGQYVKVGDPIVEIMRIDPLDLLFSVPQERVTALAVGQRALATLGACGPRFEGVVQAIEPQVSDITRTVRVKAQVSNPSGALWPGMAASVRVIVSEIPGAVRVPQETIVRLGSQYLVYVLDAESRASQRTVRLGSYFVDSVHVVEGLAPGERVVVAGHQKLRSGSVTAPSPYTPVKNPTLELGWVGPGVGCTE